MKLDDTMRISNCSSNTDDLISRKALIRDIRSRSYIDKALCEIFETVVDDSPVSYDVEAVCKELPRHAKLYGTVRCLKIWSTKRYCA